MVEINSVILYFYQKTKINSVPFSHLLTRQNSCLKHFLMMRSFFKTHHHGYIRQINGHTRLVKPVAKFHSFVNDPSSHPWPEWLGLMGMLVKKGYFGETANQLMTSSIESNHIRTACLNFARHRFTLVR